MSTLDSEKSSTVMDNLHSFRRRLYIDAAIFGTMIALSVFGVSVSEYSAAQGFRYWMAMTIALGGTSIVLAWLQTRRQGGDLVAVLRKAVLHWSSLFLALYLVYLLHQVTDRLNNPDAGLVALSMVALVTFLAGVHFDWRFLLIGTLLGFGVACAAFAETFFWVVLIATFVISLLGFLIIWWKYQTDRNRLAAGE